MNKFNTFIENFYKYSLIPLTILKDNEVLINYPKNNNILKLINYLYLKKSFKDEVGFNVYKDNLFLAKIHIRSKKEELDLLIGPIVKKNLSLDEAENLINYLKIPSKLMGKIIDEVIFLNKLDFNDFLRLIIFLNYSINFNNISENELLLKYDKKTITKFKKIYYPNYELSNDFDNNLKKFIQNGNHLEFLTYSNKTDKIEINDIQLKNSLRAYKNNIIFYLARLSQHIININKDYKTVDEIIFKFINELEETDDFEKCEELFKKGTKKLFNMVNKLKQVIKYRPIVKRAIDYINDNIEGNLQANDISKKLGINRSYLSKAFIDDTGLSIQTYTTNIKLKHAKKLLDETQLSIKEISLKLNFSSQSHFQNVFKKHFNLTPSKYRNLKY